MWPPWPCGDQPRREHLDAVHDAPEVHPHGVLPVGVCGVRHLAEHGDAGVVADHVDGAEARHGGVCQRPTWASSPTSVRTLEHVGPDARAAPPPAPSASGSMSARTRRAPRAANAAAIAAPMPLPPPVTRATRSWKGSAMLPRHTAEAGASASPDHGWTRTARRCYLADMPEAPAAPGRRPIVPFLRLPEDGGEPYLVGQRCAGLRRHVPRPSHRVQQVRRRVAHSARCRSRAPGRSGSARSCTSRSRACRCRTWSASSTCPRACRCAAT